MNSVLILSGIKNLQVFIKQRWLGSRWVIEIDTMQQKNHIPRQKFQLGILWKFRAWSKFGIGGSHQELQFELRFSWIGNYD